MKINQKPLNRVGLANERSERVPIILSRVKKLFSICANEWNKDALRAAEIERLLDLEKSRIFERFPRGLF